MPTYTYRCTKCDQEFEAFQKITDRPRSRRCPLCGKRAEQVITGGAGFLFKGEGFYTTDYRSEEYRSRAEAEKETVTDTKAEKEALGEAPAKPTPTESKPAKKTRGKGKGKGRG